MTVARKGASKAAAASGRAGTGKRAALSATESSGDSASERGEQMELFGSDSDGALPDDFGSGSESQSESGSDSGSPGSDVSEEDSNGSGASDSEGDAIEDSDPVSSSNLITNADEEIKDVVAAKERIAQISAILGEYRAYVERTRASDGPESVVSRADLLRQLARDAAAYYGYNDYLASQVLRLFPVSDALAFLEACETPRPVTIRVNTLKTRRRDLAQALLARGVTLQPLDLFVDASLAAPPQKKTQAASKKDATLPEKEIQPKKEALEPSPATAVPVALQIADSKVPIGATPEYMAGHYMLQTASSLLPVLALGAQPGERILDMSAAPGGKATHIAAMMGNTGALFANDRSAERTKALAANIMRMGVTNAVVTCMDGREIGAALSGFDRVLLDAPCSGTGVVSKDASVKTARSEEDVAKLVLAQKELVLAAIDAARVGGTVVYSTCSVLVEENEAVVDYALKKRPNVRLVPTGLRVDGRPGFANYCGLVMHPSVRLAQRFYPHVHNMDGFFVAKFVKTANKPPAQPADARPPGVDEHVAQKKFAKATRPLNAPKKGARPPKAPRTA